MKADLEYFDKAVAVLRRALEEDTPIHDVPTSVSELVGADAMDDDIPVVNGVLVFAWGSKTSYVLKFLSEKQEAH